MRVLIITLVTLALAACNSNRMQDGYQFGDATGAAMDSTVRVLTLQQRYCRESDPVARQVMLKVIRSQVPGYPADGLCTDVLGVLP